MYLTAEFYVSPRNLVTGGTLYLANTISVVFKFKRPKNRSKFEVKTVEQLTHYMKETRMPGYYFSIKIKTIRITIPNFPEYILLDFPCLTEDVKKDIKKWISKKKFKQKLSTRKENPYKQISHYHGRN